MKNQIAHVIALLSRYDALAEIIMIDAGMHRESDVTLFRLRQAAYIGHHASRNKDQGVRELTARLSANLEVMPNQLFIQAWLTMQLVRRVVQTAVLYFPLQAPRELSGFAWIVDAKGAGITAAEEFWEPLAVLVQGLGSRS